MARLAAKHYLLILGVVIGVVYGLVTRLVWGQQMALASLTYLFLIPSVLGIIPLVFADNAQVRSYLFTIFIPWITVISFFLTMWILHIESAVFLLILGAPFILLGTVGALIYRFIRIHINKTKNSLPTLAITVLPLLLAPLEQAVNSPSEIYSVTSEVTINAPADRVWNNVVRVPAIGEGDHQRGVFNDLGVPRPIMAELTNDGPGALRTGHFEGGLTFTEHITDWEPFSKVSFDIVVDPDTVADRVFDQHVLKGNYFKFVEAGYEIESLGENKVRLRLTS